MANGPQFPFKDLPLDLQKKIAGNLDLQKLQALRLTHREGPELVSAALATNGPFGNEAVQYECLDRYITLRLGPQSRISIIWSSILAAERRYHPQMNDGEQADFDQDVGTIGTLLKAVHRTRRSELDQDMWRSLFNKYKHLRMLTHTKPPDRCDWNGPDV